MTQTSTDTAVSCRGLWKVYGPHPERIVGSPEADLPRPELLEKTGCVAAIKRRLVRRPARRGLRRHGPVGLGEVDAGPDDQPAPRPDGRRDRGRRRGPAHDRCRTTPRAPATQDQHGVPALRAAPASPDRRQRRLRPRGAGDGARGPSAQGGRGARGRRPRRLGPALPGRAVGGDAAARGARQSPRHRSGDHAVRRAVQRARPADPPRHAGRGDPAPARGAEDDDLHHARPRRGAEARRPHRDHEGRAVRAGGHARGGRRPPGGRLRRRLHEGRTACARPDGARDHAPGERSGAGRRPHGRSPGPSCRI